MAQQQAARPVSTVEPKHGYSGFAVGMTVFAAIMSMMVGLWEAMIGLVSLFNDEFYVVGQKWTFKFDLTTWGWIHLILGVLLVAAGAALFGGALWARVVVIGAAVLTAVAEFAALPYYPVWSLAIITACVLTIWALVAHGKDVTRPRA